MKVSEMLKEMAAILNIAELVGPEAAKELIGNKVKKAAIEAAETASKELSDAQEKELQEKNANDSSKVTGNEQSQEVSAQETGSSETVNVSQSPAPEIKDTVEISQNAQKALEFETQNVSESEANT